MSEGLLWDLMVYLWFVVVASGIQAFFEAAFMARYSGVRASRGYLLGYVLACLAIGMLLEFLQTPPPVSLVLHTVLMLCFARWILRLPVARAAAPAIILFTLATLKEGFESLAGRVVVDNLYDANSGRMVLLMTSVVHRKRQSQAHLTGNKKATITGGGSKASRSHWISQG